MSPQWYSYTGQPTGEALGGRRCHVGGSACTPTTAPAPSSENHASIESKPAWGEWKCACAAPTANTAGF